MIVQLLEVAEENRLKYMPFFLMADECEEIVLQYIHKGSLFTILNEKNDTIGIMQVLLMDGSCLEIKNFAIQESYRHKGYGKLSIEQILKKAKEEGMQKVIVGTANSSLENILFYQKCQFRFYKIVRNYFLQYPNSIVENGILAKDMVYFDYSIESQ
ncbi:MAG: GNAT family N-acetyltransferase [Bacillus sp. (in: firmicutes)]